MFEFLCIRVHLIFQFNRLNMGFSIVSGILCCLEKNIVFKRITSKFIIQAVLNKFQVKEMGA